MLCAGVCVWCLFVLLHAVNHLRRNKKDHKLLCVCIWHAHIKNRPNNSDNNNNIATVRMHIKYYRIGICPIYQVFVAKRDAIHCEIVYAAHIPIKLFQFSHKWNSTLGHRKHIKYYGDQSNFVENEIWEIMSHEGQPAWVGVCLLCGRLSKGIRKYSVSAEMLLFHQRQKAPCGWWQTRASACG